ncbi:hypothetical protein SDC9_154731 [bioreactor metagenome]|uniref:Uncharacterized protein n=1 Tax=bioreactor metagenome TaxID=1076179 RepID=A0A645EZJ5_9ZZZZ
MQRDQKQHPVRVAVHDVRHRTFTDLAKRVRHVVFTGVGLLYGGNADLADGIIRVIRVDEGRVIGGDRHAERREALPHVAPLRLRHPEKAGNPVRRGNAVGDLPLPVVPFWIMGGIILASLHVTASIHSG